MQILHIIIFLFSRLLKTCDSLWPLEENAFVSMLSCKYHAFVYDMNLHKHTTWICTCEIERILFKTPTKQVRRER